MSELDNSTNDGGYKGGWKYLFRSVRSGYPEIVKEFEDPHFDESTARLMKIACAATGAVFLAGSLFGLQKSVEYEAGYMRDLTADNQASATDTLWAGTNISFIGLEGILLLNGLALGSTAQAAFRKQQQLNENYGDQAAG